MFALHKLLLDGLLVKFPDDLKNGTSVHQMVRRHRRPVFILLKLQMRQTLVLYLALCLRSVKMQLNEENTRMMLVIDDCNSLQTKNLRENTDMETHLAEEELMHQLLISFLNELPLTLPH